MENPIITIENGKWRHHEGRIISGDCTETR